MDPQNWYYRLNEQQIGPVDQDEIIRLLIQQILTIDSYAWTEGMENWQQIGHLPQFAAFTSFGKAQQRPTSVTVLGILNIVFGGLGILCSPFGIIGLLVPQPNSSFQPTEVMKLFSVVGYAVGFVFAIILLISGIGLLLRKNWARLTAIAYGWAAIGWGVLALIINGILFSSCLSEVSQEAMPVVVGGIIGGMCGGLIGLIYPVILIIFMKKPHVVQTCDK
ncbi:MAG: GYF domain-containing protein [Planctomycetota bacterium]